jgi:hypothetical protein
VISRLVLKRVLPVAIGGAVLCQASTAADTDLRSDCIAHFATAAEAAEVLGQKDEFIQRLSAFDRSARMKTDASVSEEKFVAFVKSNAASWTGTERARVEAAIAEIRPALEKLSVAFPKRVLFVKTTGAEEGHAFYTRDSAIIMPTAETDQADADVLKRTIAHELFHILSRANPDLREKLYQAIGFTNCGEVELPVELRSRKITNPDAPRNDHATRLRFGNKEVRCVPILISTTEKYDRTRGGEFFNYLQLKFLVIEGAGTKKSELLDPAYVSGFFEQVGRNTDYIIHPEEILADNFALLITGGSNVRSPEIQDKIRRLLEQR